MDLLNNKYERWRNALFRVNRILILVIFLAETFMFLVFWGSGTLNQPVREYILLFWIAPTATNIFLLLLGKAAMFYALENENLKNYIPIIQLCLMCTVVATVHYYFSVSLSCFSIPVMATIVFDNKRMTKVVTFLGMIGITVAIIYRNVSPQRPAGDDNAILEGIVAFLFLLAACYISHVLISFQKEKTKMIEDSYTIQLQLQEKLNKDTRTGLYTQSIFTNHLQNILSANPEKGSILLAVLNIDDLKRVNDTFGYSKGDMIVSRLAEVVKEYCEDEFPARSSENELVVLFEGKSLQQCQRILEMIRHDFSATMYDFMHAKVTVSIGLAMNHSDMTAGNLYDAGEAAMQEAKRLGKNRIVTTEQKRG